MAAADPHSHFELSLFYSGLLFDGLDTPIDEDVFISFCGLSPENSRSLLKRLEAMGKAVRVQGGPCPAYEGRGGRSTIPAACPFKQAPESPVFLCLKYFLENDAARFFRGAQDIIGTLISQNELIKARAVYGLAAGYARRFTVDVHDHALCMAFVHAGIRMYMQVHMFPWKTPGAYAFLHKLRGLAVAAGDKVSQGIIDLCIGFQFREMEHLDPGKYCYPVMEEGIRLTERFAGPEIWRQVSGMLCYYYYMTGRFTRSINCAYSALYLHEAAEDYTFERTLFSYAAQSALALGENDVAINILTLAVNEAIRRSKWLDVNGLRAILGWALVQKGDYAAFMELAGSIRGAQDIDAATYAGLILRRTLSYCLFLQGKLDESYACYTAGLKRMTGMNMIHNSYSGTFFVPDLLLAYHKAGFPPTTGRSLEDDLRSCMRSPARMLAGIAHRVFGELMIHEHGGWTEEAGEEVGTALNIFRRINAPVEKGKCLLLLIRYYLSAGNEGKAALLADEAREICRAHAGIAWPAELDFLCAKDGRAKASGIGAGSICREVCEAIQQQPADRQSDGRGIYKDLLFALLAAFGAYRGGVFDMAGRGSVLASAGLPHDLSIGHGISPQNELLQQCAERRQSQWKRIPADFGNGTVENSVALVLHVSDRESRECLFFLEGQLKQGFAEALCPELALMLESILEMEITVRKKYLPDVKRDMPAAGRRDRSAEMVFCSRAMHDVARQIDAIADKGAAVLLLGESGVGKEVAARRVHRLSGRPGPFVAVNLSSMTDELFESEMYGHEKGSFTGANYQKRGLLELADGGTLFLDEIGDIPPRMQVRMLRVLQEKEFRRVGGTKLLSSDFRIITATNQDLERKIRNGTFREDLYYRLSVVPVRIPPLRERPEDIPHLAAYFLNYFARLYRMPVRDVPGELAERLKHLAWPGNIRQLRNWAERFVLQGTDGGGSLPSAEQGAESAAGVQGWGGGPHVNVPEEAAGRTVEKRAALEQALDALYERSVTMETLEDAYFEYAYEKSGGRVGGEGGLTARLGMSRSTAYHKIKKLRLDTKYSRIVIRNGRE